MKTIALLLTLLTITCSASAMADSYQPPQLKLKKTATVKPKVQKDKWEESQEYKIQEDPAKARDVASEEDEEQPSRGPSSKSPKAPASQEKPRYWFFTK